AALRRRLLPRAHGEGPLHGARPRPRHRHARAARGGVRRALDASRCGARARCGSYGDRALARVVGRRDARGTAWVTGSTSAGTGRGSPAGGGPWLELSHTLRGDLSRVATFPDARFERIAAMPQDPMNATSMHMVCHYGTHVDAPCHFIPGGPAFHEIPLDRLH